LDSLLKDHGAPSRSSPLSLRGSPWVD